MAIVLFYIAFGLRFFPVVQCYCIARIILAVDVTLWYIRTLHIFLAIKQLAPTLIIIGEMVRYSVELSNQTRFSFENFLGT
jgi:hypothetical protein